MIWNTCTVHVLSVTSAFWFLNNARSTDDYSKIFYPKNHWDYVPLHRRAFMLNDLTVKIRWSLHLVIKWTPSNLPQKTDRPMTESACAECKPKQGLNALSRPSFSYMYLSFTKLFSRSCHDFQRWKSKKPAILNHPLSHFQDLFAESQLNRCCPILRYRYEVGVVSI